MKAENERLRRDNERFVRLIDSGEWGRGRVAELVKAGKQAAARVFSLCQSNLHAALRMPVRWADERKLMNLLAAKTNATISSMQRTRCN